MKRQVYQFTDAPFNAGTLKHRISRTITNQNALPPVSVVKKAIQACFTLQSRKSTSRAVSSEFSDMISDTENKSVQSLLHQVMMHNQAYLNRDILKYYLSGKPDTDHAVKYTQMFLRDESKQVPLQKNDMDIVYSVIRRLLMKKKLGPAFVLIDTVKECRPESVESAKLAKMASLAVVPSACVLASSTFVIGDIPLSIGLSVLCGCVISSFMRSYTATDRVRWSARVPIFEQIKRRYELELVSRIVSGYDELIDTNVANFHYKGADAHAQPDNEYAKELYAQIRDRGMRILPSEDEAMYREYWKTAGEGFMWVEPDQDPTDAYLRR
ncbi:hypothetical protein TRVA0_035S01486 [Trichomonascus vanleenenianus]|uniref:uncharacterized protein n=1 Tax=Trichomonascus vanleenenianus TaxID=2268995 RepID=UPI003EC9DCE0